MGVGGSGVGGCAGGSGVCAGSGDKAAAVGLCGALGGRDGDVSVVGAVPSVKVVGDDAPGRPFCALPPTTIV